MKIIPHKIQIETTSVCNQRCTFCPVSVEKRAKDTLSLTDLELILSQLKPYAIEKIYLNGFNEPTYDKQITEKTALIHSYNFAISFLSNGSGLTAQLVQQLFKHQVLEYTINLSTLDPVQYKQVRGNQDIFKVVPNIEFLLNYAKSLAQTQTTEIQLLILGQLDSTHAQNIQQIFQHFSPFLDQNSHIVICPAVDYAANITQINNNKIYHKKLKGCVSQRHKQWLHFTAAGNSILCCQDYQEKYQTAHIHQQSIQEILSNKKTMQFIRWVEGEEEAPDDFICRSCVFALSDDNYQQRLINDFCSCCVLPKQLAGTLNPCDYCVVKS